MSFEKPKKYVFHLNPDNARYFQSLEQDERHALINKMIESYYKKKNTFADTEFLRKQVKYIATACLIILISVFLLIGVINVFFASTQTNDYFSQGFMQYDQTQKNKR